MTDLEKVIDALEHTAIDIRQWAHEHCEYKIADSLEQLANKLKEYVNDK